MYECGRYEMCSIRKCTKKKQKEFIIQKLLFVENRPVLNSLAFHPIKKFEYNINHVIVSDKSCVTVAGRRE